MKGLDSRPEDYPALETFSRQVGIAAEALVRAFEIERAFHDAILRETDAPKRQAMYKDVYASVLPLYSANTTSSCPPPSKDYLVQLFRRELDGKSVLEVGCGQGTFLRAAERLLNCQRLVGIDVAASQDVCADSQVKFIQGDIVDFSVDTPFDVVFSDNVIEHLAAADLPMHLNAVRRALRNGGLFIIIVPNRLFGPHDVTRIKDVSYSNRIASQGTHLNEMTYSELIPILRSHAFAEFRFPWMILNRRLPGLCGKPALAAFVERIVLLLRPLYRLRGVSRWMPRFSVMLVCQAR
jgi:SAM-dependent methyltransferase